MLKSINFIKVIHFSMRKSPLQTVYTELQNQLSRLIPESGGQVTLASTRLIY
jgi:hypothetical protein